MSAPVGFSRRAQNPPTLVGGGLDIPFFLGIITAFSTEDSVTHTEYFYVSHTEDKARWKAAGLEYSAHPMSFDFAKTAEGFWKAETFPNLKNAIYYNEVLPLVRSSKRGPQAYLPFELHEVDKSTLFAMNRIFDGFLSQTARMSKCAALKDYIKMVYSVSVETRNFTYE